MEVLVYELKIYLYTQVMNLRYNHLYKKGARAVNYQLLRLAAGGIDMRSYKVVLDKVQIIDKVICNQCGGEIGRDMYGIQDDYLHIEKTWGYNSDKDGSSYNIDICQKCFDRFLEELKISAE